MRFRNLFGILIGLSLAVNFAAQWHYPHAVQFSSEAARVSFALLSGRGFADPFLAGPSGPTALTAPFYPFLHATICWIFGTAAAGWAAVVAATALAWAVQWSYVCKFAALYGELRAGITAALIGVLMPLPARLFKWEAVFTGAALAISAWLLGRILTRTSTKWTVPQFGVALSVSVLSCPPAVLIWPAWGCLVAKRLGWARAARISALSLAVAAVPIGAWTVRNYVVFGHLFFIRDAAGVALVSSNNDCATAIVSENIASGCFAQQYPTGSEDAMRNLRTRGEYEYGAAEMNRMMAWVRSHPAQFLKLTLDRTRYFWFPIGGTDRLTFLYGAVMSAFTVLSLLGLLWIKSDGFWILAGVLLPFPLIYYVAQVEQRYRYPILWTSILLTCVGLRLVLARYVRRPEKIVITAAVTHDHRREHFDSIHHGIGS